MPRSRRPRQFSATKAVKANARARLGTPKTGFALPSNSEKAQRRQKKHTETLARLLTRTGDE